MTTTLRNQNRSKSAFTLIEVIAVLVVLGILAAIALPRYVDLQASARERAIDAGIAELNGRESLVWAKTLLEIDGTVADSDITGHADYSTDLGPNYVLTETALSFDASSPVNLTRTPATANGPAVWSRATSTGG